MHHHRRRRRSPAPRLHTCRAHRCGRPRATRARADLVFEIRAAIGHDLTCQMPLGTSDDLCPSIGRPNYFRATFELHPGYLDATLWATAELRETDRVAAVPCACYPRRLRCRRTRHHTRSEPAVTLGR